MTLLQSFNFDEGLSDSIVVDRSGNGANLDLTSSGAAHATGGKSGNALTNTGSATAYPTTVGQTSNRTMMCWLKGPCSVAGWPIQWYVISISSGAWGILIISGNISIQARNSSTFVRASTPTPADINTTWHHVAGTWDGSNVRLYLDGVLKATTALTGPIRTDGVECIYGYTESDLIDDVRVYDEVLSATQIAAISGQSVDVDSGAVEFF